MNQHPSEGTKPKQRKLKMREKELELPQRRRRQVMTNMRVDLVNENEPFGKKYLKN